MQEFRGPSNTLPICWCGVSGLDSYSQAKQQRSYRLKVLVEVIGERRSRQSQVCNPARQVSANSGHVGSRSPYVIYSAAAAAAAKSVCRGSDKINCLGPIFSLRLVCTPLMMNWFAAGTLPSGKQAVPS